jgi:hypothetical protein
MWVDSRRFQCTNEDSTLAWFTRVDSNNTVAFQDVTLSKSEGDCNNIDSHFRFTFLMLQSGASQTSFKQ